MSNWILSVVVTVIDSSTKALTYIAPLSSSFSAKSASKRSEAAAVFESATRRL